MVRYLSTYSLTVASQVAAAGAVRGKPSAAAVRDRLCGQARSEGELRQLSKTRPIFSESTEAAVGTCVKGEQIAQLVDSARGFAYKAAPPVVRPHSVAHTAPRMR